MWQTVQLISCFEVCKITNGKIYNLVSKGDSKQNFQVGFCLYKDLYQTNLEYYVLTSAIRRKNCNLVLFRENICIFIVNIV